MGSINSKSTVNNNYSNIFPLKNSDRSSSLSRPQSLLSSNSEHHNSIYFRCCCNQRRVCLKKKVLILGLDGVGKTDLFTRLISDDKPEIKIDSLPRPTMGKLISPHNSFGYLLNTKYGLQVIM
jgi:hypothetical protein